MIFIRKKKDNNVDNADLFAFLFTPLSSSYKLNLFEYDMIDAWQDKYI